MIDLKTWESFNGTKTPIAEMDTRHVINAIQVIERNDPRYGVKHGAVLPALLDEVKRRAVQAGPCTPLDKEAHDFLESRKTPEEKLRDLNKQRMAGDAFRNWWMPAGMYASWPHGFGRVGATVTYDPPHRIVAIDPAAPAPKTTDDRLRELERKTHAPTTLGLVDERAARAHKRIDKVEVKLADHVAARGEQVHKIAELDNKLHVLQTCGPVPGSALDMRIRDLASRLSTLEVKVGAHLARKTPPAKRKTHASDGTPIRAPKARSK